MTNSTSSPLFVLFTTCFGLILIIFIAQTKKSEFFTLYKAGCLEENTILRDVFCKYDDKVSNEVLAIDPKSPQAGIRLFSVLKRPIQTGCNYLRRIGTGQPLANGIIWDGHKFVCLDDFPKDKPCLVYSFGLSHEISFELMLEKRGCQIYGYDHTVNHTKHETSNFHTFQYGIDNIKTASESAQFKHFEQILSENGHTEATINYLKMDIEGSERRVLAEMIEKNLLKNVQQIAMEVHSYGTYAEKYAQIFQGLYRLGFKVISFEPNFAFPPKEKANVWSLFEVVLRKTPVCNSVDGI